MGFLLPVQSLALFVSDEGSEQTSEEVNAQDWLKDPENRLWNVRREIRVFRQWPGQGEPGDKYAEQNRQVSIAEGNRNRPNGWLPGDPPGWWNFPLSPLGARICRERHENSKDVIEYTLIVRQPDGTERKLRWE